MAEASKTNWYKYGCYMLAVILILMILNNSCGKGGGMFSGCNNNRDTLEHTIDTSIKEKKKDTVYVPKPYKVDTPIYIRVEVPKPYKVDNENTPTDHPEYLPADLDSSGLVLYLMRKIDSCNAMLSQYGLAYYHDSLSIDNNAKVHVLDTVAGRIRGRSMSLVKIDTATKEKIVVSQPKKFQVLFGLNLTGNLENPFYMPGARLTFKWQNDQQYSFGMKIRTPDQKKFYEVGTDFPLRIFKRRK